MPNIRQIACASLSLLVPGYVLGEPPRPSARTEQPPRLSTIPIAPSGPSVMSQTSAQQIARLIQRTSQGLHDASANYAINQIVKALNSQAQSQIPPGGGALVRVNVDDAQGDGTTHHMVNGGYIAGVGHSPDRAYFDFMNNGFIESKNPDGTTRDPSYFWVTPSDVQLYAPPSWLHKPGAEERIIEKETAPLVPTPLDRDVAKQIDDILEAVASGSLDPSDESVQRLLGVSNAQEARKVLEDLQGAMKQKGIHVKPKGSTQAANPNKSKRRSQLQPKPNATPAQGYVPESEAASDTDSKDCEIIISKGSEGNLFDGYAMCSCCGAKLANNEGPDEEHKPDCPSLKTRP